MTDQLSQLSASAADRAAIRDWFAQLGGFVQVVDYVGARALFDHRVIGFGTFAATVSGLDNLEAGQWRSIWPTIRDFRFELESLQCATSPDRLLAFAAITWTSTGIDADGATFARPGRATVALARAAPEAAWLGVHTHFSLSPAR